MKICKLCKIEKELEDFYKGNAKCKSCYIQKVKNNTNANRDKRRTYSKKWREENSEKCYQLGKKWREENKEYITLSKKEYYLNNKEKIDSYQLNYRIENKEKSNEYYKNRKLNNPLYKLTCNIRTVICGCFKRNSHKKKSKTQEILGCSFDDLKAHLESKFEPWMNWSNHGLYNGELNYGWDIDHIVSIHLAKNQEEVIRLNHYTNLQPLCSYINRYIKGKNY